MRDFDRPLDAGGRQDADTTGAAMLAAGYVPDRVICSNAKRAKETWDAVARYLRATRDVIFADQLYITDATGYANLIAENAGVGTLLIVGHNPMIEDVCFAACGDRLSRQPRRGGAIEGPARCLHHPRRTLSPSLGASSPRRERRDRSFQNGSTSPISKPRSRGVSFAVSDHTCR